MTPPLDPTAAMLGRVLIAVAALTVLVIVTVLLITRHADWDAWAILGTGAAVAGYGVWDRRAR